MANEPIITVVGNAVADPELRFTPNGAAVANFTVASTPRTFDRQANEWTDGEALFLRCSVWKEAAENVAESLSKGMRVIVQGRLKARSYEKDGQKRTSWEMDVDEVGPALKFATAKVTRAQRNGGGGGFGGGQQGGGFGGAPAGGGFGGPPQGSFGGPPAGGQQGGFGGPPAPPQQGGPQQGGAPAGAGQDAWSGGGGGGWDTPSSSEPRF